MTVPAPDINPIRQRLQAGDAAGALALLRSALAAHPGDHRLLGLLLLLHPRWLQPLVGRRLSLEPLVRAHADYVHGCFTDPAFMALYHPNANAVGALERFRAGLPEQPGLPGRSAARHWVAVRTSGGQPVGHPVGVASVVEIQPSHRRAEFMMGLRATDDRGTGLGLEMALLVFDLVFNALGFVKLTTLVLDNNAYSQRSTEALGFTREGVRRKHLWLPHLGRFVDCFDNGLVVDDFRANARLARLSRRLLGRDITAAPGSSV